MKGEQKMTKQDIFGELMIINTLAWQDDDLMRQETLFELQDKIANLLLVVAQDIGNTALKDLCDTFPYLYKKR